MIRALSSLLWALALTAVGAVLWLRPTLATWFDVEVRSTPWQTHSGRLRHDRPLGERFVCPAPDLERIDVALAPLGPAAEETAVEFQLRADGPDGPILRRAVAQGNELPRGGGFLAFEFEPLESSAGRPLFFQIRPTAEQADLSAWLRYRGQVGDRRPWGDRTLSGPVIEGELRAEQPLLCAIAFAVDVLPTGDGTVELELFDEAGESVRRAPLEPHASVDTGYAFFPFEPITGSRWKVYRYRLNLPEGARLIGTEEGPSFFGLHGWPEIGEGPLLGMSVGVRMVTDRDLIFRARCRKSPREGFRLLGDRLGSRGLLGVVVWVLATSLLFYTLAMRRAQAVRR